MPVYLWPAGKGAGTASPPSTPTLSVADLGTGLGATATIASGSASATNIVYTRAFAATSWTNSGSRTGNGTVSLSLSTGSYWAYVQSTASGGAAVSNLVRFGVTDSDDALEIQIADAVVAEINAEVWTETITAERNFLPTYTAAQLATAPLIKVAVIPLTIEVNDLSRAEDGFIYGVQIDIQKRVTHSTLTAEIDALCALCEDIQDFFRDGHALTGLTAWRCDDSIRQDVYDPEAVDQQHIFESAILVTFRGGR